MLRFWSWGATREREPLRAAERVLQRRVGVVWQKWLRQRSLPDVDATIDDVTIDQATSLHTINYDTGQNDETPVLCLHGYFSGSAVWATSLPIAAARRKEASNGGGLHAIDNPGCGLSSRDHGTFQSAEAAEAYVATCIDRWRETRGHDKIHVVGHSIGAILATAYAERYPHRVDRLVLVSPAGMAARPSSERRTVTTARVLWPFVDPFRWIRLFPERASKVVGDVVNRRFRDSIWIPKVDLAAYFVENARSAEFGLGATAHTLFLDVGPRLYGKRPLEPRLLALLNKEDAAPSTAPPPKLAFIYGARDWMDDAPARRVLNALQSSQSTSITPPHASLAFVADGGHNLMLDNPPGFADALLAALGDDVSSHLPRGDGHVVIHDNDRLGGAPLFGTAYLDGHGHFVDGGLVDEA